MRDQTGRRLTTTTTETSTNGYIEDLHRWAVREGLRRTPGSVLFEAFCHRVVAAGVPLWRAFAGMRTLHPQWGGYTYTWRRDRSAIQPGRPERGEAYEQDLQNSPFAYLIDVAGNSTGGSQEPKRLRRRLTGRSARRDFAILDELAAAGATDYVAVVVPTRPAGDPSWPNGLGYSFATDRPEGFDDNDLRLIDAVLPALSLAIMSDAEHTIAAGLLAAYLGNDAGRRVHAGSVQRGSVQSIRAVLWFADIRGFTAIADATPGPLLIELLDDVFETMTAALRPRGGQVLKFLGDGMLASFALADSTPEETCRRALDAAAEAMRALDRLNITREQAGKPAAVVDLALHLGEVLYGNVGAVDRLDFTVIGPAVNEVARIETLCEQLSRNVLLSAALAAAIRDDSRLEPLGAHPLRGVRGTKEIFALRF
jgi:adenylate cyclase